MTALLPWMAIHQTGTNRVDVLPIADVIEHDIRGDCTCGPRCVLIDGAEPDVWMFVHASLDGREAHEPKEVDC